VTLVTQESLVRLFVELETLRLKSSPKRSDYPRVAALWSEAFSAYSEEQIRAAALSHVRSSLFFPSLSEVSAHLPGLVSEEVSPDETQERIAFPAPPEELAELNKILIECGRYPARIVVSAGSADCSLSELPTGADLYRDLSALDSPPVRLRYWRLVLSAARVSRHKNALTIRIPLRSQAHPIAEELLPAIATITGCKTVVYSD